MRTLRIPSLFLVLTLLLTLCLPVSADSSHWTSQMIGSAALSGGITGNGVVVAIIDSGLSNAFAEHSDATVLEGTNYLVAANHPDRHDVTDNVGHGTAVASIIADRNIGLAPEVTLVPLKCFDKKNSTFAAITQAIYDAVDVYRCDVINLSLGASSENDALKAAVEYALNQGVIVIAAAGNRTSSSPSTGSDPYYFPAAQDGVISVGAVNSGKTITNASTQNDRLFLTAPGYQVPILTVSGTYTTGSGTSYAAPYVTAAAALALSANPDLTAEDVSHLLQSTSEDLGVTGYDTTYGHGLLRVDHLLDVSTGEKPQASIQPESKTVSGCIFPDTPQPYTMLLIFYDEKGQFLSTALHENLTGLTVFFDISLPEDCANVVCTAVNGQYIPLLSAAHIS